MQQTEIADDQIADSIRDKLRYVPGVSYASIAEQAVACGRNDLAVKVFIPLLICYEALNNDFIR